MVALQLLHIAESYPPDYGGGAAIYVRDICRVMSNAGHTVRVLCTEAKGTAEYGVRTEYDGAIRIDRVNLPYFKLHDPDGWQLGLAAWRKHERRVSRLIEDQLSNWIPNIIHYHTTRPLGEECLITIHRLGIPAVAFVHEAWLICPRIMLLRSPQGAPCAGPGRVRCLECLYSHYDRNHARAFLKLPWRILKLGLYPAYRLWRRSIARRSLLAAIGYSKFMVNIHTRHLNAPVQYLPLGLDLTGLRAPMTCRPRSPLRFGFFGGFQPTKGVDQVLDAARALKSRGFQFALHIWGPGELDSRTDLVGLEDTVSVHGMYSPDQLWTVLAQVDVAVMATNVCEPFGRIPLEAAAAGVPTIGPAIGGITETIRHGFNGLLYRFRDAQDLANQMSKVLDGPELVSEFFRNLQPVSDISSDSTELEKFYLAALQRAHRSQMPLSQKCANML